MGNLFSLLLLFRYTVMATRFCANDAAHEGYAEYYGQIDRNERVFPTMFLNALQGPRLLWRRSEEAVGRSREVYISLQLVNQTGCCSSR